MLLAPLPGLCACRRRKGTGFEGYAFVANQESQTVAVVDLLAFAVARYLRLEASPTAILAHPRRPSVYVLVPSTGALHEIAVGRLALQRKAQLARAAVSMRLAPDGSAIWVLCRQPRELVRISLDHFRADARIALPADPLDFDLSPDGRSAAVSFGAGGTVVLADLVRRASRSVELGKELSLVRFRSDGLQLLVGNAEERLLTVLEAAHGRLVVNLPLAVRPDQFCVKSDGGQLFVTGDGMDAVAVVYPYTTEVAETALAGRAPGAMAECSSADADYLFVANPKSGEVTILDIDTHRAIAAVAVGENPGCVVITPDQQYALVLNRRSGDVAVIRVAAIAATRSKSAPLFTMIPVGSAPVSAAVRGV